MKTSNSRVPNLTHAKAAEVCHTALRALGLKTTRAVDYRDGYDFLVEGKTRVAVRYAFPTSDRVQRYKKRNGEVSRYVYKRWTFNFHRHGKMDVRYCDFFVCLLAPVDGDQRWGAGLTVFVIPWEAVTGLTFCSSARKGSNRTYRGKYARYRDAWQAIEESARPEIGSTTTIKIGADTRRELRLVQAAERRAPARRRRRAEAARPAALPPQGAGPPV